MAPTSEHPEAEKETPSSLSEDILSRATQFGMTARQLDLEEPIEGAMDDARLVAMYRALRQRGPVDLSLLMVAWWEGFDTATAPPEPTVRPL